MRRILPLVFSVAAISIGAAQADGLGVLPAEVVSLQGSFRLTLQSNPAPLPLNELFEITVSVDASAGSDQSANPVWLRANAQMPDHKHGMNTRVIVDQLGDGRFLLKGLLFHMRGDWLITFDVAKGRVHEQATARVQL